MQYLMIRANVFSPFASHGSVSVPNIPMFHLYRDLNGVEKGTLVYREPARFDAFEFQLLCSLG